MIEQCQLTLVKNSIGTPALMIRPKGTLHPNFPLMISNPYSKEKQTVSLPLEGQGPLGHGLGKNQGFLMALETLDLRP